MFLSRSLWLSVGNWMLCQQLVSAWPWIRVAPSRELTADGSEVCTSLDHQSWDTSLFICPLATSQSSNQMLKKGPAVSAVHGLCPQTELLLLTALPQGRQRGSGVRQNTLQLVSPWPSCHLAQRCDSGQKPREMTHLCVCLCFGGFIIRTLTHQTMQSPGCE